MKNLFITIGICCYLLYIVAGNNNNDFWNGLFFCANYWTIFWLFMTQRHSYLKIAGLSISITAFLYSFIKFFTIFEVQKEFNLILFTIILTFLIKVNWKK